MSEEPAAGEEPTTPIEPGVVVDPQEREELTLRQVAETLEHKHQDHSPDEVAEAIEEAHQHYADAPVRDFVPIMVEREAAEILRSDEEAEPPRQVADPG
jgi:hypothetical protein